MSKKAACIIELFRNRLIAAYPDLALYFIPISEHLQKTDSTDPFFSDGRFLFYDCELVCQLFMQSSEHLYQRLIQLYIDYYSLQIPSTEKIKKLLHELRHEISAGNGRQGKAPAHRSEKADISQHDTFDYHQFLSRFTVTREEAILDSDSFDYIPYHFGLTNYQNMPFIEPLEYKEVHRLDELAIAIDTSASCSGNIVRRFLQETWSILSQKDHFFSKMRLHFFQCDSMIQDYRVFTSREQWEEAIATLTIEGHGNTDFCPVFDAIDSLIQKNEIRSLRGLLYFTDGDGIFPRKAPSYETAFVFLNHELEKHKIPDWGIRLNLNDDSFVAEDPYL